MNTILGIDTSTEILSIALAKGEHFFGIEKRFGLRHSSSLLPLIQSILDDTGIDRKEIDLIVCAQGPGSFTGLRIGIATVKGLSMGLDCPFVLVPTLDIYADKGRRFDGIVVPVIDARKKRLYAAFYKENKRVSDYMDLSPEALLAKIAGFKKGWITGPDALLLTIDRTGWQTDPFYNTGYPRSLIRSGLDFYNRCGPSDFCDSPLYLRRSEAEETLMKRENGT